MESMTTEDRAIINKYKRIFALTPEGKQINGFIRVTRVPLDHDIVYRPTVWIGCYHCLRLLDNGLWGYFIENNYDSSGSGYRWSNLRQGSLSCLFPRAIQDAVTLALNNAQNAS